MTEIKKYEFDENDISRILWALTDQKQYFVTVAAFAGRGEHDYMLCLSRFNENKVLIDKILKQKEDILKKNSNPFAIVVLAVLYSLKKDKNLYNFKVNLTRMLGLSK